MAEKKTYTIYRFYGVREWQYSKYVTKKMSLKAYFDKTSHWSCPDTMRFRCSSALFHEEYKTMAELRADVQNGVAIFPFTVAMDTDVVKNYIKMGMDVVFMTMAEYRIMKKDYCLVA